MSEEKTLLEVLQEALDERRDAAPAGGDLEAEKYVDGRWGHQSRGQRKRLIEAFKAGVKRERNRPAPSRPEGRGAEYLRSVVEQIHRDAHDALSAVPVQPPPRDPAGEGEEVCETCDHFEGEHVEVTSYRGMVVEGAKCTAGACLCRGFRARPSSSTGETAFRRITDELTDGCGCACHTGVGYNTMCVHCQPTGETPCATCGGTGYFDPYGGGSAPCGDCQPTPSPAGQGVEEAFGRLLNATIEYDRAKEFRVRLPDGSVVENPEIERSAAVPVEFVQRLREAERAVEQAIRAEERQKRTQVHAQALLNSASEMGSLAASNLALRERVESAEAERDRLREENSRLTLAVTNAKLEFDAIYRVCHADSNLDGEDAADSALMKAARASRMMARALAGESTGATEGEK